MRLTTQAPVDGERSSQSGHANAIDSGYSTRKSPAKSGRERRFFTMVDQTQGAFRNERALETRFVPEYTGFVESEQSVRHAIRPLRIAVY